MSRFKYGLHVGMDANYRLRERMVSSDARDPTLGQGLAYFVNKTPYIEHIKNFINQDEVSDVFITLPFLSQSDLDCQD